MQIDSCPTCSFTEFPLLPSVVALFCAGLEGLHGVIKENILKRYKGADITQINTWMYLYYALFLFHIVGVQLPTLSFPFLKQVLHSRTVFPLITLISLEFC